MPLDLQAVEFGVEIVDDRRLQVVERDAAGRPLMRVETFEPVSENPVFTLQRGALAGPVDARGRDNNGNAFDARIAP